MVCTGGCDVGREVIGVMMRLSLSTGVQGLTRIVSVTVRTRSHAPR